MVKKKDANIFFVQLCWLKFILHHETIWKSSSLTLKNPQEYDKIEVKSIEFSHRISENLQHSGNLEPICGYKIHKHEQQINKSHLPETVYDKTRTGEDGTKKKACKIRRKSRYFNIISYLCNLWFSIRDHMFYVEASTCL